MRAQVAVLMMLATSHAGATDAWDAKERYRCSPEAAVGFTLADVSRWGGVHIGMVGLALNVAIAVAGSALPRDRGQPAEGRSPRC